MLPENRLSTYPVPSPFIGAGLLPNSDTVDYVDGPVGVQNTDGGLRNQKWRARLINADVSLVSPNTPEFVIATIRCCRVISLAFDQNARYLLAYLIDDVMWLYWYDPLLLEYTHMQLATGVSSLRMSLDDKRMSQSSTSQILLVYVQDGDLYYRKQADRYGVPYLLQTGVAGRIIKVGMNKGNRFQILFEKNPFPVYEDPYPAGTI